MKLALRNRYRLDVRRLEAASRAVEYSLLTPQQKLGLLDRCLGVGVGAVKQRAQLQKQIQDGVKTPDRKTVEKVFTE